MEMLRLLGRLAQGAEGQLGDLGALAGGDLSQFGPTTADQRLIEQSIGATSDIVRRQIADLSAQGQSQLGEQLAGRGIQGSSIEAVNRAILERDLQRQGADIVSQAGIQGSQALMNLPFQRAGVALNANQLLFNRLLGAANPILQINLQERLAQARTTGTQTQPGMSTGDWIKTGIAVGGAPFTGGASLGILGMPTSGTGGSKSSGGGTFTYPGGIP